MFGFYRSGFGHKRGICNGEAPSEFKPIGSYTFVNLPAIAGWHRPQPYFMSFPALSFSSRP
ncbi:hypothetical protein TH62_11670 [Bacillus sp. TH008]|nr:hypothetical protein TH62_11670 [Bacillus sp. TH008]